MPSEQEIDRAIVRASELGSEHGRAAGTWVIDGNTTHDACRALLDGIEDGDPAVYDALPSAPLSGEWADAYSVADLATDTGIGADHDAWDDVCDAFEMAWHDAMVQQACADALGMLPEIDS